MIRILCPWCKKKGVSAPSIMSWEEAEKHFREHGATKEQIEQAHEAWRHEINAITFERREAMEACL